MPELAPIFPVNRVHLDELSDDIGIMQHAIGRRPDPAHGYCTDDVARALQVDLLHGAELGWPAVADRAERSVRFLEAAFNPALGRFRNFRSADGTWLDSVGSEDAHARAALALAETAHLAGDPGIRSRGFTLFERALPATIRLTYLRPRAAAILAGAAGATAGSVAADAALPKLLDVYLSTTTPDRPASSDWPWPEPVLTYENGLIARALIVAGGRLGDELATERGLVLLGWLVSVQTAPGGHFSPIGNDGWWPRGGSVARYDQQPMEATALLLAAQSAYEVTGDRRHTRTMEWAYAWFLGQNDGHCQIALPASGAGQDGLTPSGPNANQGAESTLMWLTALERIRAIRRGAVRVVGRSNRPSAVQVAARA